MMDEKIFKFISMGAIILLTLFLMFVVVCDFPEFGSSAAVTQRVGQYYIENTLKETGALNAVIAILWDYRGYDTLGETLVLFTAIIVVIVVLRYEAGRGNEHHS